MVPILFLPNVKQDLDSIDQLSAIKVSPIVFPMVPVKRYRDIRKCID